MTMHKAQLSAVHSPLDKVPPGYKRTEVGVIPDDWDVTSLGDIGKFSKGKGIKRDDVSDEGVACIRYGELYTRYNNYVLKPVSHIPPSVAATAFPIMQGDLLFAGSGETAEEIGKCVAYLSEEEAYAGGDIVLLRPSGHNSLYLGHLLNHDVVAKQKARFGQGDAVVHISARNLAMVKLPLPPEKDEQDAIAGTLSDVDGLIGALDKLITKKRAIKQAAMQQLLTGKTRLPEFSGKWETKQLGELIHLIPSGIYGLERQTESLVGMPVATTAHIDSTDSWNDKKVGVRYFTESQVAHYAPSEGDLIVVKSSGSAASIQSGKIGFVSGDKIGSFIFSNFLMLLRPVACNARFLFFQLISGRVKRMLPHLVEASTYPNIRINDYLEIQIPLPPAEEQAAIATVLSDMDAEIAALERRRDKTKAIKQGIIQALLTGRVRLVKPGVKG
ncbi:MAG: restriction endonuclease subunit S [Gemmatimonadetes bacterium]|nr:restriction endonuclease subunit S [Gemmatimonadota bacterium]